MGNVPSSPLAHATFPSADRAWRILPRCRRSAPIFALVACAFFGAGCKHIQPLDTKPLDAAGLNYNSIKELVADKITAPEVLEIAKAREGGLTDAGCVQALQIYHGRGKVFDAGDRVSSLLRAGFTEDSVLEFAKMDQLGIDTNELIAMRLTGLSDEIVLTVARRHSEGKPVLSGVSLASIKNTGVRQSTLLELARRGVPDSDAGAIIAMRRKRASDADILRHFSGS
jgi:hypothetical protein